MDSCLNATELERLAQGGLRGGARARAEGHLSRCATCRGRIEAHRPPPGTTLGGRRPGAPATAPTPAPDPASGRLESAADAIEGFRLLEEIHRGGQGVVWRALDERRNEIVALKVLREGPFATADQRMRFERESELARGLDHPLIVAPLETGVSRGRPYHVMQYVEGLNLDAWARETQPSLPRILEVFRDACDAVAHAHSRGVIHRDLKPSNVLVDARGRPHVVDFGVAKSSLPGEALPLTVTGEFVGTLSHASPEQAQGDPRLVDELTDVYALGLILYELLTGRMPYVVTGAPADVLRNVLHAEPRHPATIDPTIDDSLAAVVLKALAKEPGRRYASVAALRDDVSACLEGLPVRARPEGAWDLLARTARRNKRWFLVAAAFAAVLAGVAALATVQAARFSRERDRATQAEAEARARARELEEAGALLRRQSHAAHVAAASLSLQVGRLADARRRLAESPSEMRGWEWSHLALAAAASEAHVAPDGDPTLLLGRLPDGRAWRATRTRLQVLDASSLEVLVERRMPDIPLPDEGAAAEILTVAQDASLVALRWDDASWTRLGAPGRSILVADFEGRIQAMLSGAAWRPDRAAFSSDGRRLVATTAEAHDASPRAWSTLTGESTRFLSRAGGGDRGASPVAFSPDGLLLVEAGGDGRVRAWTTETSEPEETTEPGATAGPAWEAEAHGNRCVALAFSRDGSRLATAGADGTLAVLGSDGSLVARLLPASRAPLTSVALDHDGGRLAAGDADGRVLVALPGEARWLMDLRAHEVAVAALAFAGSEDTLLTAGADGSLERFRADPGAGPAPLLPLSGARAVAFSPDGLFLAATGDGLGRVFEVASGRIHGEWPEPDAAVALAFSPDGATLLVAGGGSTHGAGAVRARQMADLGSSLTLGEIPGATFISGEGLVLAEPGLLALIGGTGLLPEGVGLLADGAGLSVHEIPPGPRQVFGMRRGDAGLELDILWSDGSAGTWTESLPGLRRDACGSLRSPASAVAAHRKSGDLRIAVATGDEILTCSGQDGAFVQRIPLGAATLLWSPDGTRLFAGDNRGVLSVLSADPLETLLALDVLDGPVRALATSPDGRLVAAAGPSGVRLLRSR